MKLKSGYLLLLCFGLTAIGYSQGVSSETMLARLRTEGFKNTQAMEILSKLTDVYGQRLTGSREYFAAAQWISSEMKNIGLQNVHFEQYCPDCRGWSIKTFNVEMTEPNYFHIAAFPLVQTKSTNGVVSGEVIQIESNANFDEVKAKFTGKLKDKVILLGKEASKKPQPYLPHPRLTEEELSKMEEMLVVEEKHPPLPELLKMWEHEDDKYVEFLQFVEAEGALAILETRRSSTGILHPSGTYYYKNSHIKPLPYFTIIPEHFDRMLRMLKLGTVPKIRLNLETEFYSEPEKVVNIIGQIPGSDPKMKNEQILLGAHFDSWHSGTGATDNAVGGVALIEAMRILIKSGYTPRRTITIGLWGGEEQAFMGSENYATTHFGEFDKPPNNDSKKVSVYLNLDNGAGAIRGVYLQDNEFARPVFAKIFEPIRDLSDGALTIENTLETDHETFDYYNIPAFQFIQDPLDYEDVTHHTYHDVLDHVPEGDLMKNAVILAWTIYSIDQMNGMVPRKLK